MAIYYFGDIFIEKKLPLQEINQNKKMSLREGCMTTTAEGNSDGTTSIRAECGLREADKNQSRAIDN